MYLKIWKFMLLATLMLSVAVHAGFELEAESKASQKADVVESVEFSTTQAVQDVRSVSGDESATQEAKALKELEEADQLAKEEQAAQEVKALKEAQEAAQLAKEEQAAQEVKALKEAGEAAQLAKEEQAAQEAKALKESQEAAQLAKEEQAAQEAKALKEAQEAAQLAKEEQAAQEAKALKEAQEAAQLAKEQQAAQEAKALKEAQEAKEAQKVRSEQIAQAAQIFPRKIITSMISLDLMSSKASQDEQVIEEVRVLKQEPVVLPLPSRWDVRINDVTLRQTLSRWSSDAGWQLAWEVRVDYPVQLEASFSGTFESAVEHFINALRNSDYPLVACLYEANRVVRVLHYGENKGCVQ